MGSYDPQRSRSRPRVPEGAPAAIDGILDRDTGHARPETAVPSSTTTTADRRANGDGVESPSTGPVVQDIGTAGPHQVDDRSRGALVALAVVALGAAVFVLFWRRRRRGRSLADVGGD